MGLELRLLHPLKLSYYQQEGHFGFPILRGTFLACDRIGEANTERSPILPSDIIGEANTN